MDFSKKVMHNVPTYDELVRDIISNPTDNIALPDRMAMILRNTPQLTRFDDATYLNLSDEQDTITKHRIK